MIRVKIKPTSVIEVDGVFREWGDHKDIPNYENLTREHKRQAKAFYRNIIFQTEGLYKNRLNDLKATGFGKVRARAQDLIVLRD